MHVRRTCTAQSREKRGKADHRGKANHHTLINLPELPSSFRDSHYLRFTLLRVLNVMTRRYDCVSPLYSDFLFSISLLIKV